MPNTKITVTLDSSANQMLDQLNNNLTTIVRLLEDNARLLSEFLQCAPKVVQTPLELPQIIPGDDDREAAGTGDS